MAPAGKRGKGPWITDYRSAASEIRRDSKRSKTCSCPTANLSVNKIIAHYMTTESKFRLR